MNALHKPYVPGFDEREYALLRHDEDLVTGSVALRSYCFMKFWRKLHELDGCGGDMVMGCLCYEEHFLAQRRQR